MLKQLFPAVVLALALGLPVLSAAAAGPTIETFPPTEADQVIDGACHFPVFVHADGKVTYITWSDASGAETLRQISVWPGYNLTFTNQNSGKSKTFADNGPGFLQANPDGSSSFVGTGPWAWWPNGPTGEKGIFMTQGRWVAAADGLVLSLKSHTVDVCAALAK